MRNKEDDMKALELFFWCFFFAMEVAWICLGVQGVVEYIYRAFKVDDLNRLRREVAELRSAQSEEEIEFDTHYHGKSYVKFVNEK